MQVFKQLNIVADGETVYPIDVDKIIPCQFEPQVRRRQSFKQEEIEQLGNSIARHKLRQPILVRPLPSGELEIVFGERRWLAVKSQNQAKIKCFVEELSDVETVSLQYEENHKRQNINALDDAFYYKFLQDTEDLTVQDLADRFSTTKKTVRYKLSLNNLIPEAKQQLSDGHLPSKHAYHLATFPENAQEEIVRDGLAYRYNDIADGALPFEHFVERVAENIVRKLATAPFDTEDPRLHMTGLPCSKCPERSHDQGRLFAEIAKDDSCLNSQCFKFKTNVHLRLQRERIAAKLPNPENAPIEEKIKEVPLVTERKFTDDTPFTEKVITNENIFDDPQCEFSVPALSVDGAKKGCEVYRCTNSACEIHHPKPLTEQIILDDAELQEKEYEFEQQVKKLVREKVFAEAIKFFTDYNPFWTFDDLIQKLILNMWTSTGSDAKKFIRGILKDWKNVPREISAPDEIEEFIASLDKRKQSQLLFLLTFKTEGYYTNSSLDGLKKIAADYAATDWKRLDAKARLELAPEQFKPNAQDYLEQVLAGADCEPPHFWFTEEENFDAVELSIDD